MYSNFKMQSNLALVNFLGSTKKFTIARCLLSIMWFMLWFVNLVSGKKFTKCKRYPQHLQCLNVYVKGINKRSENQFDYNFPRWLLKIEKLIKCVRCIVAQCSFLHYFLPISNDCLIKKTLEGKTNFIPQSI